MALVKLSLPTFTGTGGASELHHFLDLFESYCRTMHLDGQPGPNGEPAHGEQMSVFSHCMKLNTKAAEWWSNTMASDKDHETWAQTRILLTDRFYKKKNPGELAALVST